MSTLSELEYYCKEDNPVGALMLTGEWGCGKTYLLEHQLKDALTETHILVRVSLFGMDSIDTLNKEVKKQWITQCTEYLCKIQDNEKLQKVGGTAVGAILSFIPGIKDIKDSVLAINPYDYITISPLVDDGKNTKRVVLIFDDLERSRLNTIDVLGCINEYCENMQFNTIIVANEKIINKYNDDSEVSYEEIKEKIICRTIEYKADYRNIIHSIISARKWDEDGYKNFLLQNEELIIELFNNTNVFDDEEEGKTRINRPQNIRSLMCGLQDFYRVYKIFLEKKIPDIELYFYMFMTFMMVSKSQNLLEDNKQKEYNIRLIYPFYNPNYLLKAERNWILHGDWNEDLINYEIQKIIDSNKELEPKEILRGRYFGDIEDSIIQEGFSGLLEDCYSGRLNLDEYDCFIQNANFVRRLNIDIPEKIQWDKVVEGIKIRIQKCIDEDDEYSKDFFVPDEMNDNLSEDEKKAYELLYRFDKDGIIVFEKNRKEYIRSMKTGEFYGVFVANIYQLNVFDSEMAEVTLSRFVKMEQSAKGAFIRMFEDLWAANISRTNIKYVETKNGFELLIKELNNLKDRYLKEKKQMAALRTNEFIDKVEKLNSILDNRYDNKGIPG